jgi:hypothetical protein
MQRKMAKRRAKRSEALQGAVAPWALAVARRCGGSNNHCKASDPYLKRSQARWNRDGALPILRQCVGANSSDG